MSVVWSTLGYIGWALLYVLLAIVVVLIVDFMLRGLIVPKTRSLRFPALEPSRHEIVYLHGILADGERSSVPVRDTWRKFGNVLCFDYGTKLFIPKKKVESIATKVIDVVDDYRPEKLTFVLSSMGGILGLDVWAKIRDDKALPGEIEMHIVDGIQGSKNMVGPNRYIAQAMRVLPVGPLCNVLLGGLLKKTLVLPKDGEIEKPLRPDKVKREAYASMSPYKPSIQRDQAAYMAGHDELTKEDFAGVTRVYYYWCTLNNETVNHPNEMRKWKNACKAANVEFILVKVKSPHCAYAQMPRLWNRTFEDTLSGEYKKHLSGEHNK